MLLPIVGIGFVGGYLLSWASPRSKVAAVALLLIGLALQSWAYFKVVDPMESQFYWAAGGFLDLVLVTWIGTWFKLNS